MATTGSPQGPDGPILTLVIMTIVFLVALFHTFFRETFPDAPPLVDQLAYWLAHKEQFCILSHLASQVMSIGLRHLEEITVPVLDHFPQMTKK